ncbi:hypothetical protein pEaSNUABM9_00076 [Erwinia phage pEa_SNUABM_9]|nr:hypothetical protein pEaSNUABM9_00076 [Erwinia phage pEa_SNUABM_9]
MTPRVSCSPVTALPLGHPSGESNPNCIRLDAGYNVPQPRRLKTNP